MQATMSIWDNKDNMMTVWKVKDLMIIMDENKTSYNVTIFKRKKNKVITSIKYDFDEIVSKDDALIRIKAHLICDGIIWQLKKDAFGYIFKVKNWKEIFGKSEFDVLFQIFDQNFRLLIW